MVDGIGGMHGASVAPTQYTLVNLDTLDAGHWTLDTGLQHLGCFMLGVMESGPCATGPPHLGSGTLCTDTAVVHVLLVSPQSLHQGGCIRTQDTGHRTLGARALIVLDP